MNQNKEIFIKNKNNKEDKVLIENKNIKIFNDREILPNSSKSNKRIKNCNSLKSESNSKETLNNSNLHNILYKSISSDFSKQSIIGMTKSSNTPEINPIDEKLILCDNRKIEVKKINNKSCFSFNKSNKNLLNN